MTGSEWWPPIGDAVGAKAAGSRTTVCSMGLEVKVKACEGTQEVLTMADRRHRVVFDRPLLERESWHRITKLKDPGVTLGFQASTLLLIKRHRWRLCGQRDASRDRAEPEHRWAAQSLS